MIRQSSSRNQRSKGIRVKHVLQICMLLAICCWLTYQVKHSYDKRKHIEENDGEISGEKLPKFDEDIKLGRKDIHPPNEELSTSHEKIEDEEVEDDETLGKGDDSLEETQEELERKRKEEGSADIEALLDGTSRREEEARGLVGDDNIDEQDLDKVEKETDGDKDVVDGDKDIEKDEENENEVKDVDEDNEHQQENDGSSDDQDHDSNGDRHEAREEHYRADDASSAVAHVGQNILTENPEHKKVNEDLDAQELVGSSNETGFSKEQHLYDTNVLENSNEATPPRLEDVLVKYDTDEASSGTGNSTLLNEGHSVGLTHEQNSTTESLSEDKSSNTTNETEHSPTITNNTTGVNVELDENSNSTMSQDFSNSDLGIGSNATLGTIANRTESFNTNEHEDVIRDRIETEEDSILSSLHDDETLRDPLISEEEDKERESLIDLGTLPELGTEGTDSDDAATE